MRVTETVFFKEALRFIGYGCQYGWHERNAGNISLRLNNDEIAGIEDSLDYSSAWTELAVSVPEMSNELVFTTVSGSYFIDIQNDAEAKFCICEISGDGASYRIVWGGNKPTSELCGHLMSLGELKKRIGGRAVYHCHPANLVALSYIIPQSDKAMSNALWESETECAFVFPEGIGVVGFCVPGSLELANQTADKIKEYNAVLWSNHGIFASGDSITSAFGLVHAIEKAAEIKLKVISSGQNPIGTITEEQQKITAATYGFELRQF